MLRLKILNDPAGDPVVKIISPEMIIPCCCKDLYHSVANLDDGDVKCTAAQIKNHDFLRFAVVQSIGKSSTGGLIDNTLHIQPGDPSCILGRLPLYIIKIRGNRDHSLCHFLAGKFFRILFQLP